MAKLGVTDLIGEGQFRLGGLANTYGVQSLMHLVPSIPILLLEQVRLHSSISDLI